jgi:hypothetical protein
LMHCVYLGVGDYTNKGDNLKTTTGHRIWNTTLLLINYKIKI